MVVRKDENTKWTFDLQIASSKLPVPGTGKITWYQVPGTW